MEHAISDSTVEAISTTTNGATFDLRACKERPDEPISLMAQDEPLLTLKFVVSFSFLPCHPILKTTFNICC